MEYREGLRRGMLFFNTIRYLKAIQIYWRVKYRLSKYCPFSIEIIGLTLTRHSFLIPHIKKTVSLKNKTFTFLNESITFDDLPNWHVSGVSKLWLYNLHYFDFINQGQINSSLNYTVIKHWIANNKVSTGEAWEPYPISLRIVNWVKFFSIYPVGQEESNIVNHSLFLQSRFLYKNLEYHLLGNHLFKNCVALLYAGAYFSGVEPDQWLLKGKEILFQQLEEQILSDGCHFERTPMYHSIILEDVLDCLNLGKSSKIFSLEELSQIKKYAYQMMSFLFEIIHPDGRIPFFNDCAFEISREPAELYRYASDLGLDLGNIPQCKITENVQEYSVTIFENAASGFYVFQDKKSKIIINAGAIGPDYLPGHSHCDTLSYELSIGGNRCIVNSGTYQYAGEKRNDFRLPGLIIL
jgi:uncharacterized heparinase superfamily protein